MLRERTIHAAGLHVAFIVPARGEPVALAARLAGSPGERASFARICRCRGIRLQADLTALNASHPAKAGSHEADALIPDAWDPPSGGFDSTERVKSG
jgi:hypothetical protein